MSIRLHLAVTTAAVLGCSLAVAAPALASPPSNDGFGGRIVIGSLPFTHTENTIEATTAADDPAISCAGAESTVWFAYTPSVNQRLQVNTFGSGYDTTIDVYTGSRGSLTNVACNDDITDSIGKPGLRFDAVAGKHYKFMVSSHAGEIPGSTLVFNLTVAVPPFITLRVTSGTVDRATGNAILHGSAACSQAVADNYFAAVTLRQVKNGFIARGTADIFSLVCDGTLHPWTSPVESETSRAFRTGTATANTFATACDLFECADAPQTTVRFRLTSK